MPSLTLRGVTVNFPFSPYESQKAYMNKVIECLQEKVNGVLESPTGTGKTLCLLCATLAWRENFKDTMSTCMMAERLGQEMFPNTPMSSWGTAATDSDKPSYYTDVPKIIYATRTHSQLTQVINELKNTSYSPKVCVMGSREQLCINQDVMCQKSNHVKVSYKEKSTDRDFVSSILDVEDLVQFGNKQRVCPYYLSRSLKQEADVIFMPYNYLLDPKSRKALSIDLNGAVVIFDEAHNVEKTCEESTSFDLTPYDVASAINAVDRLLVEQSKEISHRDSVSEDVNVESLSSGKKTFAYTHVPNRVFHLILRVYTLHVSMLCLSFIYEVFEKANLTFSSKTAVYEALEHIIGYLARQPGIFLNTSGLQKLSDIIQVHFVWLLSCQTASLFGFLDWSHNICVIEIIQQNDRLYYYLFYWCFSPAFSMQDLVNQGIRCIILTSGTLSPLSSFTSEMRIEFPVCLENSHVIERDQIFVGVIAQGPDGVPLSSAFDRRFVPENMASLANLSRLVPHGLLVFFPSFPSMEKTLEFWRATGHANRIEKLKPMFVEPTEKGTFNEVSGFFRYLITCEGLDFADMFGRGVIITGLPFPPKKDPRVVLKMQFLDEMNQKNSVGQKYLSGQDWYRQQAFRAVNQAIGRVIRHKEDYGAIFLCDQRFKNADTRAMLPSWVRSYVRLYDTFGNVVRDVSQFFRTAQKMVGSRTCTVHTMLQILSLFSFVKEPANSTDSDLEGRFFYFKFDENCQKMARQGCGYKPDHTLSKDRKNTVMLQNGKKHALHFVLGNVCEIHGLEKNVKEEFWKNNTIFHFKHERRIPGHTRYRCSCTLCRPLGYGVPCIPCLLASYTLLLCAGLSLGHRYTACTWGLAWCDRPQP
uniref:Regulator of telomere elongation helicase 1 homolog n=1 Tax=Astatotilapia calliptera TaxID=8154 RepID=A0AAX7VKW7_ASTCA